MRKRRVSFTCDVVNAQFGVNHNVVGVKVANDGFIKRHRWVKGGALYSTVQNHSRLVNQGLTIVESTILHAVRRRIFITTRRYEKDVLGKVS